MPPGHLSNSRRRRLLRVVPAALLLGVGVFFLPGCGDANGDKDPKVAPKQAEGRQRSGVPLPLVKFTDVTRAAGVAFRHTNGAFGQRLLPETMGSGVCFLDYDNDGRQDLLFVNSCYWPGHEQEGPRPTLVFYRNKGDGTFEDVTARVGLDVTLYGMGVTAGDIDNDGWTDLFVTAMGGCRLYRNVADKDGKRRFDDITHLSPDLAPHGSWLSSGKFLDRAAPMDFPSSAAFFDYNNDGLLDLFVCHYVTWSPQIDLAQSFTLDGHNRAYGPPKAFKGSHCRLFKNLGGGKFADVSEQAGIQVTELGQRVGKSLGVHVCDADEDGWQDVIVANDTVRNFFFHNRGDGTFVEKGLETGVGLAEGAARGAMGIDGAEYGRDKNGNSKFAIAIGNFAGEPDTLLKLTNPKRLMFQDVAMFEGVGGPSRRWLVFGLFWFDYDLDGRLDLLSCNGHLEPEVEKVQSGQLYRQPPQLFWNTGQTPAFAEVTAKEAGADLFQPLVGRGSAFADIDGDGDLDVVLTGNGEEARLLRNEGGTGHHWVRLVLEGDGKRSNRSAIGARVVLTAGGQVQKRHVVSGRGYLSQSELPLTFGLGKATKIDRVEIYWPGAENRPQVLTDLEADREHRIKQKAL